MEIKKRGPGRPRKNPLSVVHEPKAVVQKRVDMVNHPPHYKKGGIETIDFIEAKELGFNLGNAV